MNKPQIIAPEVVQKGDFVSSPDDVIFEIQPEMEGRLVLALQRLIEWGSPHA